MVGCSRSGARRCLRRRASSGELEARTPTQRRCGRCQMDAGPARPGPGRQGEAAMRQGNVRIARLSQATIGSWCVRGVLRGAVAPGDDIACGGASDVARPAGSGEDGPRACYRPAKAGKDFRSCCGQARQEGFEFLNSFKGPDSQRRRQGVRLIRQVDQPARCRRRMRPLRRLSTSPAAGEPVERGLKGHIAHR